MLFSIKLNIRPAHFDMFKIILQMDNEFDFTAKDIVKNLRLAI